MAQQAQLKKLITKVKRVKIKSRTLRQQRPFVTLLIRDADSGGSDQTGGY